MESISRLTPNEQQIRSFLTALNRPGSTFEIRILNTRRGGPAGFSGATYAGYFDDVETAVAALSGVTGLDAPGVYVTINELDPSVRNRGLGRLSPARQATSDKNVVRLRSLYVDLDPVRPTDTNATQAELAAARERSRAIVAFLSEECQFPLPVWQGTSGNGAQLMYRIDLGPEDKHLVESVLKWLDQRFSDDDVKVDTTVGNPARITRVAGTVNAKAETPQPDRPWRLAEGTGNPEAGLVTAEMIQGLLGSFSSDDHGARVNGNDSDWTIGTSAYDIPKILSANGIGYTVKQKDYGVVYQLDRCLTSEDHDDGAAILQFPSGAVAYRCLHNRCSSKSWNDIKQSLGLTDSAVHGGSNVSTVGPPTADDWDDPVPLDPGFGPPLPLDSMPPHLSPIIRAVAEETQTPPDLAAVVALGVLSAAAGGQYIVSLPENGWKEPVHLQLLAVADPASRKSGVYQLLTRAIGEFEAESLPADRKILADWESRQRVLEHNLKHAEEHLGIPGKDGKVAVTDDHRLDAVLALEQHRSRRPSIRRILTDDATPESLKSLLAEQRGAIAVLNAESTFLSNVAGRYSNAPNLDVLLNGHAGDNITVDRKGKPPEIVPRACVTLCLMVQPRVIADLGKIPGFKERGAAARMLVSLPRDFLGSRRIDVHPVPPSVLEEWNNRVRRILEERSSLSEDPAPPKKLTLSPEAAGMFREFRLHHEPLLAPGGAHEDIRDWSGKLEGAVLRIAGLLHIAKHPAPEARAITEQTMQEAIALGEYFTDHAHVFFRMMNGDGVQRAAATVLGAVAKHGPVLTQRDLHQHLRGHAAFQFAADLEPPLRLLERHGLIKRVEQRAEGGGRPSTMVYLNPRYRPLRLIEATSTSPAEGFEGFEDGSERQRHQSFEAVTGVTSFSTAEQPRLWEMH